MEPGEYDKLDRLDERMWWFSANYRNVLMLSLQQLSVDAVARPMLDAGCGTGGFLAQLADHYPNRTLFGLDADPLACRRAAAKSARPVCAGSINALPFLTDTFSAVFSIDVLCHRAVDEHRALLQFHRCLTDGGWLVVNVPAYRWMLSRHDAAVHNVRRYTATRLGRLLEAAGFHLIYITYWNAILFPLMVISRKVLPRWCVATSDVIEYPSSINAICRLLTTLETVLLRRGLKLPFGGSIIAVATKRGVARDERS